MPAKPKAAPTPDPKPAVLDTIVQDRGRDRRRSDRSVDYYM